MMHDIVMIHTSSNITYFSELKQVLVVISADAVEDIANNRIRMYITNRYNTA
jgi:hypothetical protein